MVKCALMLLSKGYQLDFGCTIESGVQKAAKEFGVEAYFIGSKRETEISKQISMVENAINKVSAIALAALNAIVLSSVSKKAVNAEIQLVTFDSNIGDNLSQSFIATE